MPEPIGSNAEFVAAANLITTDPLGITAYQMRVLRSTHPAYADQAEREQAEARSPLAIEEHRKQQDAQLQADAAQRALPPLAGPSARTTI